MCAVKPFSPLPFYGCDGVFFVAIVKDDSNGYFLVISLKCELCSSFVNVHCAIEFGSETMKIAGAAIC